MNRIPLLSEQEALERGRELGIDDYIAKMHIFRVLLQHPDLAGELNGTIIKLVSEPKLISDRLREIIIMRVAWLAHCNYEWSQHWLASLFFGLTEQELASIRQWPEADCFSDNERVVLQAVDELIANHRISDQSWQNLRDHFDDVQQQVEIVTVIGNWHMFALILNGLDIPLDDGMASWPPDGNQPG